MSEVTGTLGKGSHSFKSLYIQDKYESNHVGPIGLKLERSALLYGSAQHDDCVHVESEAGESYGEVDDVCACHDLLKVPIVAWYQC